jgi:hypothetical protein
MVGMTHTDGYRTGITHLRQYIAREGHANVSKRHVDDDGFTLGAWMDRRRNERRAGRLSTVKVTELNALGMVWDPREANYQTGVDHLQTYIAREGHAVVPNSHVTDDGFPLGAWVSNRREDRTVGRLTTVRTAELNTLGMVWDSLDAGYRIGVEHLRVYTAAAGHANVHRKFVTDDGFKLGVWVSSRRSDHRAGTLSAEKITELSALGMVWDLRDANYRTGLDHLRVYTAAAGHANVPATHVADDGFKLGVWVDNRRNDRRIGRISTTRIAELNALGMGWRSSHASRVAGYRTGVDHLRAFTAVLGHANVPRWYVTDDGFTLGVWVSGRREDRTIGRLSAKRIAELNALGMVWDIHDVGYRIGVAHLRSYIAREGHGNVPQGSVTDDGFSLGNWVASRRRDRTIGRLTTAKIAELNALGMVWGIHDAGYRTGVDHLRAYTAAQGHANMLASHVAEDGFKLGAWVANRRHDRKIGRVSTARIAELDALGMVWDARAV